MYLAQDDWKRVFNMRMVLSTLLLVSLLKSETLDDALDGFDDEPVTQKAQSVNDEIMDGFDDDAQNLFEANTRHCGTQLPKEESPKSYGFTGKVTEQVAYSYNDDAPHDNISSLKTSLLLDYEHKFDNGFKLKMNGKAYYNAIYDLRGSDKYSSDELDELRSEIELFDAYIEGSLTDSLDIKLGRQVVVWGRSDTIRVTDVLNPLDSRRPAMVDIEDLRLPVAMAKFDYFMGDWRVTPMAILEQRFSKNPPFGSAFNPSPTQAPDDKGYSDILPALSVGGEFSGWDVNFYATQMRTDLGVLESGKIKHDKVTMFGTALNILSGSWLFKSEVAHFDETLKRTDALIGVEYNGIADTLISYDVAVQKVDHSSERYQHAFRISSDFINATLKANYLISLFGSKLDDGGFQRAWVRYDIADGIYTNIGLVDYIGGSKRFDAVSNNDMAFMDLTYSF